MSDPNSPLCWICGDPADSSEHRLKKADIVRAYGSGPYRGDSAPVHFFGPSQRIVQGPGSEVLKYSPSLCVGCNSAKSQPYDRAYDTLIEWIFENESLVLRKRFINFHDVYGPPFALDQLNLYKYFAKSFGCKLADASQPVRPDLVALFDLTHFQTALRITFSVNEDILLMRPEDRNGFIGKSGLLAWLDAHDRERVLGYQANEHVSWFTANFWYACAVEGDLGSVWVADSQHVYLGSHSAWSDPEGAEFMAKSTALAQDDAP